MAAIDNELDNIRSSRPDLCNEEPALFERSLEWSYKVRRELLKCHVPAVDRDPIFFWSYGPQGSGKSTTVSKYFVSLGVNPLELNIDALTKRYAKEVLEDEERIATNTGYFSVRNKWPNYVRHLLLRECSQKHLDIVWETTGRGANLWSDFCAPLVKNFGYKIVVVYVLVPFAKLKQRLEGRVHDTKQCHATFDAVLAQCRAAAKNTQAWFTDDVETDVGGFVYFNNCSTFGKQERIHSEADLRQCLMHYAFDPEVASAIKWRGTSDQRILKKTVRRSKNDLHG